MAAKRNDLTVAGSDPTEAPLTFPTRSSRDKTAIYRNAIEPSLTAGKNRIEASRAPSRDERAFLERRLSLITSGLGSANRDKIRWRLNKFFKLYPGDPDPDVIDAYADALSILPLWAIERACNLSIAKGTTFKPSAPELAKLASDEIQPFWKELDDLRIITMAEVYKATEDRKAVMARMRAQYPTILPDSSAIIARQREEARRRLAELGAAVGITQDQIDALPDRSAAPARHEPVGDFRPVGAVNSEEIPF